MNTEAEICKADRHLGANYGKPHVWVPALRDGEKTESCLYCGRWRDVNAD